MHATHKQMKRLRAANQNLNTISVEPDQFLMLLLAAMNKKIYFGRSLRDILFAFVPACLITLSVAVIAYKFVNPAPPNRIVISTGEDQDDYQSYAKLYKDILKEDGVELITKASQGPSENLKRLKDESSDVQVGFVQDGLGNAEEAPDLSSLGSLYYEPIWIFYSGQKTPSKLSDLMGQKIAIGRANSGTNILAQRILKSAGVTAENTQLLEIGSQNAVDAIKSGEATVALFLRTGEDPLIEKLMHDPSVKLMNLDQAEAITRQIPFLHHLTLPHGAFDLKNNIPAEDINLVSPTITLLVRDDLHPALVYLLLKAAVQVHSSPGLFERKDEFPVDKDYQFSLREEAKSFYKSGTPFWQRFLPFWLATLLDRFLLLVIPVAAIILPMIKVVPKIYVWRIRNRIFQRYGELKFIETQLHPDSTPEKYLEHLDKLDAFEMKVNHLKVPLDYSDYIYSLREHIDFVRGRIRSRLNQATQAKTSEHSFTIR